jgi:transcriptional regulator with XRE-family HTH domain
LTTPDELGMRIKKLRERRKWTQERLAKEAGISRGYLARLETGRHDPPLSTLTKLADALGVKLPRLVD